MAITALKIHPAIGIARVGNSPDGFFIGPERPLERPDPPGGFKDSECRVKRQAARFRVFAYHDTGSVDELTAAEADITWTVHVANKKAITRNSGSAADLTIDPGPRTLTGPNQQQLFDTGQITLPGASALTVPLGEARTDTDGHLVVLGGFGTADSPTGEPIVSFLNNEGWYDDVADGPVTATVHIHSTGDTHTAVGAWVIVAPPKFAPGIDNVITLYDRLFDFAVSQGWLSAPATPSYTRHIHPILQRARDARWLVNIGSFPHSWPDPVIDPTVRNAIFSRLSPPGGGGMDDMPQLNDARLTPTQYEMMEKWKDGTFTNDWAGPPAPPAAVTPDGLDQAALENCVGAAFFPGIEAGGIVSIPILVASNYLEPIRLDPAVLGPGDVSEFMAVPWQADFNACGDYWWPVPRPNWVIPQGETSYQDWDRDVGSSEDMAQNWHTLGFVVRQGSQYVEVDRCAGTFITLLTPHLDFQDVPQGPMGMARKTALAIVFEVRSTGGPVTLQIQTLPTHPRLVPLVSSVTVGPTSGSAIATARIWLTYETGPTGETVSDQVVVAHPASGQTWTVSITANTVARKVAAAALVLDRSGSMSEDRGDGQSKHRSLQEAASIFVDVMLEGDGVALTRYNQDAQQLQPVTALGPVGDPFDTSRTDTKNIIHGTQLDPNGATSIGDGIFEGRQQLNAAGPGYDVKALVVLTDGKENQSRFIADVAGEINELTYAVGLGTPANTSAPALQNISGNHGGYLLVTGPITGDNRFILQKFFLQILAGISNAEIVMDPAGELARGRTHRIPFQLTEADAGVDVILLSPQVKAIDFRLQTPNGFLLEPWRASAEPSMRYVLSDGVSYYRVALPTELVGGRFDRQGTWHAVLEIGRPRLSPRDDVIQRGDPGIRNVVRRPVGATHVTEQAGSARLRARPAEIDPVLAAVQTERRQTLPYSLLVHSYSNLSFRATLQQSGFEPGARVMLHASLAESGVPMARDAAVWVEIILPDGNSQHLDLRAHADGQFSQSFTAALPGVYRCRVRASGRSAAGHPFQREQTLTAAVWRGGDRDADPAGPDGPLVRWLRERDEHLCRLLQCLLAGQVLTPELERRLRGSGIDLDQLRRCLLTYCKSLASTAGSEDRAEAAAAQQTASSDASTLLRELAARLGGDPAD